MYELSLFSGGLGGVLATHHLLGWRQIGYVEIDKYCQKVISKRIKDRVIPEAPIFGDIRTFISEGFAESYKGLVDVITAGFPCQPFSVTGKREGENSSKNLWPETIKCIRIIRPQFAFMENVPGLLTHSYARRIFGDLAESGYDVKWRVLSAAELGAPHKRNRLWIVANTKITKSQKTLFSWGRGHGFTGSCDDVSHSKRNRWKKVGNSKRCESFAKKNKISGGGKTQHTHPNNAGQICNDVPNANNQQCNKQRKPISAQEKNTAIGCGSWWQSEPDVGRVAHGVANRVDRLKALGNGQVPAVAAAVWRLLNEY